MRLSLACLFVVAAMQPAWASPPSESEHFAAGTSRARLGAAGASSAPWGTTGATFRGCTNAEVARTRELLSIELGFALVKEDASEAPDWQVDVGCDGPRFLVEIRSSKLSVPLRRPVRAPTTLVDTRARVLAIGMSELLAVARAEALARAEAATLPAVAGNAGTPEAAPVSPPLAPVLSESGRTSRGDASGGSASLDDRAWDHAPLRWMAEAGGTALSGGTPLLLGGGIRLGSDRGWSWVADALVERGSSVRTLGQVTLTTWSAGFVLGKSWDLSGASARAGIGPRLGVAALAGKTPPARAQAESLAAFFGGPMIGASLSLFPMRWGLLEIVGEGGFVAFGATGAVSGDSSLSLHGGWLRAAMCLGVVP